MRWSDYYEKINDWSVSTSVSKISSLEDMGAPDEIVDALNVIAFEDEKGATSIGARHQKPVGGNNNSMRNIKAHIGAVYMKKGGFHGRYIKYLC